MYSYKIYLNYEYFNEVHVKNDFFFCDNIVIVNTIIIIIIFFNLMLENAEHS